MEKHPEVRSYLKRLKDSLRDVPRDRREEIVGDVESHISEELERLGRPPKDHEVRNILDALGDPAAIAAAEIGEQVPSQGPPRGRGLDVLALIMLLVGSLLIPYVGWIIGVVLLWTSPTWTAKDKLLGTVVVPGGLALPFFLYVFVGTGGQSCSVGTEFRVRPDGTHQRIRNPRMSICESIPPSKTQLVILCVVIAVAAASMTVYLARRMRRQHHEG